jgi:glucosamine-6-phosphate deaminase
LDNITRIDASKDFPSDEEVPYRAITMGIGTILKARSIIVMAWGQHKANMVRKTLEGQITPQIPASFLQRHPQTEFHIDNAAASKLTRNTAPWLVNVCNWDDDLVCKAVVWLSKKLKKPILKLTNEDYAENGLSDLMLDVASSYSINIRIFNRLQRTITGWPGGKPNEDDLYRPERAVPAQKRAIIFSPHPDDDVISMGGTFLRLVDQGHDVHVAYQTSGNIAVHDHDAKRFVEFMKDFNDQLSFNYPPFENVHDLMIKALAEKSSPGKIDVPEVRLVKGLIRRGEARAGARFCGLSDEKIHFLDLPFYETGTRRKNNLSQADVDKIKTLLQEIKPHQIFAAGDLADPHDTHKVCLDAILAALKELKNEPWIKDCWLWLYRGAWHEFEIHEIHMTIPLSPEELIKKRRAIFMHQSQKDRPPFPGDDEREFWQRAEERNKATAQTYRNLGLSEYEAMEAFARYDY